MKKTNNKGFSLVELIVVIAIMAVLVGVLAPQFLKYVERGRKSTDVQNVASIISACDAYAADDAEFAGGTITLSTTEATIATDPGATNHTYTKALWEAGIKKYGLKSSKWVTSGDVTLTVTVTNGVPSYAISGTGYDATKNNILTGKYE